VKEDSFRDGIINLNTRQFGTVVELIVKLLRDYQDSEQLDFDLFDPETKMNIEVKSSRVYRKRYLKFNLDNLYDLIVNNSNRNRLLTQAQAAQEQFDCNIQQVKTELFDALYYLLFFSDVVEIFRIGKDEIRTDANLSYSDKQHKGAKGEGQFHVNHKNYEYHKEKYFVQSVTYSEIKDMLLRRNP